MSFEENNSVLAPPGTATSILAVMVAALFSIAILDVGPLLGISDDANAILTLLAAGIFVIAHGYVALGWRNILAFSLITAATETHWAAEEWSLGGMIAHFAPGVLTNYGQALRKPAGRIHWASSEYSEMHGLMEGAVRSGESAADQVLNSTTQPREP
jgi:hypothetical protein